MRVAVLLSVVLLSGCATEYSWRAEYPPSREVEWTVVSEDKLYPICAKDPQAYPNLGGCAFQIQETGKCWIFSSITRWEAGRRFSGDGITLLEHELRHCRGERHD